MGVSGYESLVVTHLDELKKYCFRLTRSKWDAEDLCQDAAPGHGLFFGQGTLPERKTFPATGSAKFVDRPLPSAAETTESEAIRFPGFVQRPRLCGGVQPGGVDREKLPRRSIEILLLFDYFAYTMQEIADIRGITVSTVKSVLFRTRALLRQYKTDAWFEVEGDSKFHVDAERWSKAILRDMPLHAIGK